MKPPRFEYACPSTLDEVLDLIATDNAKLLAGGQTLVPILNFRLAAPTLVVDINRVAGLDTVQASDTGLHIGAMVRWHTIERSSVVAAANPLLREAVGHIAHYQIRNRGTVGGSCAHADPAVANLVVVDLRHLREVEESGSTLPGALHISPHELDHRHGEIARGREVVLFCS